ncbi:MAG: lysine--tRNA ligase [candidate division WOR-3 bacterium]|nr:lysine--tRNA ligase [candidate division WOR-3 bacterium]
MEERLKKLKRLRELKINPYPYRFDRSHTFSRIKNDFEELSRSQTIIKTAGRIITIRRHGKTIFATLNDENEKMQIYLRKADLGEGFEVFENFDIGDFIGVEGKVFKTRTGEITVHVEKFTLLTKSLRPLPEKWHGLRDIEIRYRKRYLDLIANQEVREIFRKRSKIIKLLRNFFDGKGFLEVETPVLQPIYGGAAARPFKTFYNALNQEMYLRIADELYLKRLIVGGYEKVWEFCRDFRNEGLDRFHNPEFTMIEAYQAYTDYYGIMELVEELLEFLVKNLYPSNSLTFGDKSVELKRPFKRIKYTEALKEILGVDILKINQSELDRFCQRFGIKTEGQTIGYKIDKLFSELVQKNLIEPTFVIDYPKVISPLAKEHREDPALVERFELIIFGLEIANAFSELNDPIDQRKRFEQQLAQKEEGIAEIDEDFIEALEYGMPPTGGLGIGVDRLCMILLNQPSIRDVILFPQLRREDAR